jgi:hypothetical protein
LGRFGHARGKTYASTALSAATKTPAPRIVFPALPSRMSAELSRSPRAQTIPQLLPARLAFPESRDSATFRGAGVAHSLRSADSVRAVGRCASSRSSRTRTSPAGSWARCTCPSARATPGRPHPASDREARDENTGATERDDRTGRAGADYPCCSPSPLSDASSAPGSASTRLGDRTAASRREPAGWGKDPSPPKYLLRFA